MSVILEEARLVRELYHGNTTDPPKGFRHRTPLELVVAEGVQFLPELAPVEARGQVKQCYRNAGNLALFSESGRYIYVEGFAVMCEFPLCVSHAWVYDLQEGKALEVTWPDVGPEYLGVAFDTDWLIQFVNQRGAWGVLDSRAMLLDEAQPQKYQYGPLHGARVLPEA